MASMTTKQTNSFGCRISYFLKGFFLGGIPIFILSVLSSDPFTMACSMALLSGLIFGILAFAFGKKVIHFLVVCLKGGGG